MTLFCLYCTLKLYNICTCKMWGYIFIAIGCIKNEVKYVCWKMDFNDMVMNAHKIIYHFFVYFIVFDGKSEYNIFSAYAFNRQSFLKIGLWGCEAKIKVCFFGSYKAICICLRFSLCRECSRLFGEEGMTLRLFLKRTAPFSILWTLTNYLYVLALRKLTATDVSALYCCHKAFVFLLSWIVLKDRFMGVRVCIFNIFLTDSNEYVEI